MRSTRVFTPLALALLLTACDKKDTTLAEPASPSAAPTADEAGPSFDYPDATRVEHVDDYHGIAVADPYRWLEDIDSDQTRAWVEAQNEVTFGYLETIEARDALRKRLTALWDYERWGVPRRRGDTYFVSRNDGLQNQAVLYTMKSLTDAPKPLLDPNTLSEDGTVALSGTWPSRDGKYLAYGVSDAGSDWQVWRVRDVATGKDLSDELRSIKFAYASWSPDNAGFYYARYPEAKQGDELEQLNYDQKLYYHELGKPQSEDVLVYERPDHKEWGFDGSVSHDGKFLVITVRLGTDPKKSIIVEDLRRPKRKKRAAAPKGFVELLPDFQAAYSFIGNDGDALLFRTNDGAPRGRIIAVDFERPQREHWQERVPQSEATLRGASIVGGRLVLSYLDKATSRVAIHTLAGKHVRDVTLPGLGTASGVSGEEDDPEGFFSFTSLATPSSVYRVDVGTGEVSTFKAPTVGFDPDDFVVSQVFYPSKDGTSVPMFIAHKKGVKPTGDNPTYLYGYGGFNIPLTPTFSVPNLVWMEMGGVFAMPNLRGGGEFGEAWHQAGTKLEKQNVFDDFIAAAEYLIAQGWTAPERLSIGGRSNGGLLVGATMTQRPDLFEAALPGVGVMDMLRFNKFTIGWAWESDYGSPQDAKQFEALYAYSPYHNIEEGTDYPATMIYTADHDDRVLPAHSYKFAAALQHAHTGSDPVLIRIDVRAGHGAGKPTAKRIEEWADLWGFLVEQLEMDVSELPS
ncbi:MAG: prolyl oligopeptidase family serine peptidase [bacterium]|nr:prolyl oligopeptidase family serine peptidase [bacterium]